MKGVQFAGEPADLHAAIGQWSVLKGVQWRVIPTDYVGGSFDVTFIRRVGPISVAEANLWVQRALKGAAGDL